MKRVVCLAFVICASGWAQEAGLQDLRHALDALRPHAKEHPETRGATPELTAIKHRLRDWAESRIATFQDSADEDALNRELQETLLNAGVFCPDGCPFTALGYVDQVRVHRQREFLTVQTSVGIGCGYDDSAYVYEWSGGAWKRIFETEQNNYTKTGYLPQTIYAVQISQPDAAGARLILSLGSRVSCASAFQPLYYRLWRIGSGRAKALLDASEIAFMGAYPPVRATLSTDDVRLEFTAGGTGYGSGHEAVRHFTVLANGVRRVEPIAPTPRDFVEEWLAAPWKKSAKLAESAALQPWHAKLHRDDGLGDFPDPPVHCSGTPAGTGPARPLRPARGTHGIAGPGSVVPANDIEGLWQIGIRLHGVEGETFYLVRWRQPDHFTMSMIADHPLCK